MTNFGTLDQFICQKQYFHCLDLILQEDLEFFLVLFKACSFLFASCFQVLEFNCAGCMLMQKLLSLAVSSEIHLSLSQIELQAYAFEHLCRIGVFAQRPLMWRGISNICKTEICGAPGPGSWSGYPRMRPDITWRFEYTLAILI